MATKKESPTSGKTVQKGRKRNAQRESSQVTILVVVMVLAVIAVVIGILTKQAKNTAPLATTEPASVQQNTGAPAMSIDTEKQYLATVKLEKGGEFVIELYPKQAPVTVNSFVYLARKGYFDGVTFHRVLKDFMAQTGDPTGTGSGGPGYTFQNEDSELTFDKEGVVAMANAGRDTNGSQFFITYGPQEYLNGDYTIFGQVISGMDVVRTLTLRDPEKWPDYTGDVIASITITEK